MNVGVFSGIFHFMRASGRLHCSYSPRKTHARCYTDLLAIMALYKALSTEWNMEVRFWPYTLS